MKIDVRDEWFAKCVKERAEWTCERCGKYYPEGHRRGLDCSHYFGRRSRSTRWHPDNAFAHCRGCHQYLGSNPLYFTQWVRDQLGDERHDWLMRRHHKPQKYTKADLREIARHYRTEHKRMYDERMNGVTGYLEFVSYD